mmetsp:Transcript_15766/g.50880  ORF Transcript_15766/g.50880 Transcript_15766/m.50880 type:complete len:214 (-) Transcript_15766:133-774(-)
MLVAVLAAVVGCGHAAISSPRRAHLLPISFSHRSPLIQMRFQRFASWHPDCEAALNNQIAVETAASFQYLAMYAYFDRPGVALKQATTFFEKAQAEEIGHAKAFIKYQNTRGGKVTLQQIQVPEQNFTGDASQSDLSKAMEKALELEIFVYDELLKMHKVAESCGDPAFTDLIEQYLGDQIDAIRDMGERVAQLERLAPGGGHAVWHWDEERD